jgi:dUTP pyrophosphatase
VCPTLTLAFKNVLKPRQAEITVLPGGTLPERGTKNSIGFDLSASQDMIIENRQHKLVPTGLIIKPPQGYWLMLAARSSLIKRGLILANGIGVVDPDYCGPEDEVRISLYNVTDAWSYIKKGDRLAQGMFLPIPDSFEWLQKELPEGDSRGGFGSTGQ